MNATRSKQYIEGLKAVTKCVDWTQLKERRILITGATGLIGSAIVDLLMWMNKEEELGATIYAASRNPESVYRRFDPYGEKMGLIAVEYDAMNPVDFSFEVDYIIHAASNASPDAYVEFPVDTMLGNIIGVHEMLEYAKGKDVKRIVYISSSEVYGSREIGGAWIENEYGYVDLLNPRASYSMGKRAAETLCISYVKQYDCPVSIVRPGHIYGPTARNADRRVSSEFMKLALNKRDIVLKSSGTQIRSYCHCLDCATAILTVLVKGGNGVAYNISNRNSIITIYEMAELIAEYSGIHVKYQLPKDCERNAFNPMQNSSLDSNRIEKLGWSGVFDAKKGLEHTIDVLRELNND